MRRDALVMFAKAPVPGQVKTRLAADLGSAPAAALQEAFLRDLGARFVACADERVLAAAPDLEHPVFRELASAGWRLEAQGEGDLGARLQRAVAARIAEGFERVVIIGSDSPTLPLRLVDEAFTALDLAQTALGPVFDGGYYLIATRIAAAAPFTAIPWGTHKVFTTTLARLESARISYRVLPFWYDVDDFSSLGLLAGHLGAQGPYGPFEAPATERVLRELGNAL